MKICWLISNDRGGGVVSVALSCCRQAARAGHETTLLMALSPTNWLSKNHEFHVASLNLEPPAQQLPQRLLQWIDNNPQDIIFINNCEKADWVISHIPPNIKCVYVVHDAAIRHWKNALKEENNLEAIIAVSETIASQFRGRLKQKEKLSIIFNGCVFPEKPDLELYRQNDIIFLGGSNPFKGAFDLLKLWQQLIEEGFTGKLHWFGSMESNFKDKISQLPSAEQIIIYGRVKREVIFSTATKAKVILMLSRAEAFGMATIEAMSMGCVPVAWDIETGTKEIIPSDEIGLFAPLGNTKLLAHQVSKACNNHHLYIDRVVEHARTHFSEAAMWQGYEYLIKHLKTLKPIQRTNLGKKPIAYRPPLRYFQLFPLSARNLVRYLIGRSPRLGYWLRNFRGM